MTSMMEPEDSNNMQAIIEKLTAQVSHPSELDAATKNLSMPAFLLNFYFATLQDLSPIGKAIYIPVQITEREGGRKSLFYLDQGEEVLAGIYVTDQGGVMLRYIKRVTGDSLPAQTGDIYSLRITSREGKAFFQGQGNLEMIDPSIGKGTFMFTGTSKATEALIVPQVISTVADCECFSLICGHPQQF